MNLQIWMAVGAGIAVAAGSAAAFVLRQRGNPREKERQRREMVATLGRMIEGNVTSHENGMVQYSYHWRGVQYEAAQDISDICGANPASECFSGPVTVKFLSSRPSNSILMAEKWSGIPIQRQPGAPVSAGST